MLLRRLLTNDALGAFLTRAALVILVVPVVAAFLFQAAVGLVLPPDPGVEVFSWALLGRSLFLAAVVAVLCGIIGAFCGVVAGRLSRAACALALFAFIMPLAIPPSVHAYVWRNIALAAGLLGGLFVEGGADIVNCSGAVLSMTSAFWSIPALAAFAVAAGPARRYELEARPFAPPSVAARRILVPSVLPAAAAAAGLVFILAFGEYGAVALWQINTFPAHIMSMYLSTYQMHTAAAASLVPALVTGLAAVVVFLVAARALAVTEVERVAVERETLWRPSVGLKTTLGFFVALLVGAPLAVCGAYAFSEWSGFSAMGGIFEDLGWSVFFACAAGILGAVIAVFVAATHWMSHRAWRIAMGSLALAAFLVPAAGAGLAAKSVSQLKLVPLAFGDTPALLVYAFAGRFIAVPLLLAMLALSRVDKNYRDLARMTGARGLRLAFRVCVPIALPAVLAGFVVAVVLAVAELPIALLVSPPGRPPVSVDLFNLMHYARQSEAFSLAIGMALVSSAVVMAALALSGKLWKRYLPTL